jgi:hypothetical protein
MRLEYGFELSDVQLPCFAVEAIEGIGKLFTLATLVLKIGWRSCSTGSIPRTPR